MLDVRIHWKTHIMRFVTHIIEVEHRKEHITVSVPSLMNSFYPHKSSNLMCWS